jgi:hypothetical protein
MVLLRVELRRFMHIASLSHHETRDVVPTNADRDRLATEKVALKRVPSKYR